MIKIYHNPRCAKSRQGLAFLQEKNLEFETVLYLKNGLTHQELSSILQQLDIRPEALLRKSEKIWKENYKGKELSDQEIIKAMLENPKLIERPIVSNGKKAVIARPAETIDTVL
ncbi:MAG: arsenate reductase (glutaredoxin) [Flavicella sp.]